MPKDRMKDQKNKMGRVKNYLRYSHEATFGLVAASRIGASIKFLHMRNTKDRFVAVPANENVYFWDLKTKEIVNELRYESDNASEVSAIECYHGGHPRTNLIAVGYANGHVRVFQYETGALKTNFTGHRTSISALAFDKTGSRLASGSKDCNIVVWDVFGEKGLFCLKGHTNSITKLAFLYNEEYQKDILVSSSVDPVSTIKFWDLHVQHCFRTVPGNSSGVWSFVLIKNGTRLIVGSNGPELKVYSIQFTDKSDPTYMNYAGEEVAEIDSSSSLPTESEKEYGMILRHMGNLLRNTSAISDRVEDIVVDEFESLLLCHSVGKTLEVYGLRSPADALSYAKKRIKKERKRSSKRKEHGDFQENELQLPVIESAPITSLDYLDSQTIIDCEINRKYDQHKLSDNIKAIALKKLTSKNDSIPYKISVISSSNKISSHILNICKDRVNCTFNNLTEIDSLSHRNDVRSVAISSDNSLILSSSKESLKVWRLDSRACIGTVETEYGTCCIFAEPQSMLGNQDKRFALLATKTGNIQIIDLYECQVVEKVQVCTDGSPLESLCALPGGTGIVCGGGDKTVRFLNYTWVTREEDGTKRKSLSLEEDRKLEFPEGITCVKISSNSRLLAVALLDSTVRIHFTDTLKYFLTLYGHKFPVTTMDVSDDNTMLASGSPDKNIKIWGLDFGDCHKSIFAHEEAITCVKFVPKTHYVFSCGRDKAIKQWDCDSFIRIQALKKHQAEIWCMDVSANGKIVVTGSHDKSLRLYRKTDEILVPSVEEETERELEDEKNTFEQQESIIPGEVNMETGFALKMTIETVKSTDRLIEAINVFGIEQEKEIDYRKQCELAEKRLEPKPQPPEKDPLLLTAQTQDYRRFMLEILRRIRSSEMEEILITLPFDYVRKLLIILVVFIDKGWDIELMVRCATFLLRVNFSQIATCSSLVPVVTKLRSVVLHRAANLRDLTGYNLLALEHLNNKFRQNAKVSA